MSILKIGQLFGKVMDSNRAHCVLLTWWNHCVMMSMFTNKATTYIMIQKNAQRDANTARWL